MLTILDSYQRKFKVYCVNDKIMCDVLQINLSSDKTSGIIQHDQLNGVIFDDSKFILHEYTGLDYIDGREAYDGDIFRDKRHGDLFRIYRIEGGFAISVNSFSSTFTGSSPFPLTPLADAQTTSWFHGSAEYVSNIHEFILPESYF